MKRHNYNVIFYITYLIGLFYVSGCDKQMTQEAGILEGVISIGPICPVESVPPDPACLPTAETYKAYPVSVWTSDNRKKIAQINPALDGSFRMELPQGNYRVILEKVQNTIGSSNLPVA
ncbi:MAG: hypothetical protein EPN88_16430, partial [Bacteroidetes bacterium]